MLDFIPDEDLIDEAYWLEKKRNRFYASFGVFALSLPITIFLNAFYNDMASKFSSSDRENRMKILLISYILLSHIIVVS
jgi:hypothetical protein